MQVLIVGSGGREHALAWKTAQSKQVSKVYVAPGNAGTALEPGVENVAIPANDVDGLLAFAQRLKIELTIIGPEDPLVMGISDRFKAAGLACFGPSAAAAQLEGSKAFAKEFMQRHGIATAAYGQFTDVAEAVQFIREHGAPIVVAKGRNEVALKIREIAAEHKIPTLEVPPLARALYRDCELEAAVPSALYAAVAEVMAYVYQLNNFIAQGGPPPAQPSNIRVPAGMDPGTPD